MPEEQIISYIDAYHIKYTYHCHLHSQRISWSSVASDCFPFDAFISFICGKLNCMIGQVILNCDVTDCSCSCCCCCCSSSSFSTTSSSVFCCWGGGGGGGGGSGRQNFVGDVVVVLVDSARVCCYCNRRTNAQYEETDSHGKTTLSKN